MRSILTFLCALFVVLIAVHADAATAGAVRSGGLTWTFTLSFVAIGGIDEKNIRTVKSAGARTVAVVRAIMASADPKSTTEALRGVMA